MNKYIIKCYKINKYLFFFTVIIAVVFIKSVSFSDENETVRVGLEYKYKSADNIPVANKSITIGNGAQLYSENGFVIKAENRAYIELENKFSDFSQAKSFCESSGYGQFYAYPVLKEGGSFGIYVGAFGSVDEAKGYMTSASIKGNAVSDGGVGIFSNNTLTAISGYGGNLQISSSEPLNLGERSYRGKIEFIKNGSSLTAVNVVSMEEYLYCVVGSEMPPHWDMEALKAQAVAARSFSSFKKDTHNQNGYELCDNVHCQLYTGISGEDERVITAVDETKGIKAYYNDEVINAVYCSSNGGYSASSKSVWNFESEYLKAVDDYSEEGAKQWTRSFTFSQIASAANNVGEVTGISIEKNGISPRVERLIIKGTQGQTVLEGEKIRTFFSSVGEGSLDSSNFEISGGVLSSRESDNVSVGEGSIFVQSNTERGLLGSEVFAVSSQGVSALIDSLFAVDSSGDSINLKNSPTANRVEVQSTAAGANTVVFNGKGWGHGVGMSQYGAKSMAENGYTYDQILKHYYTGIEVK